MIFNFSKEIYNKQALLKACYNYTDRAFIHIDVDCHYYLVEIEMKPQYSEIPEAEFQNEVLAQMVRQQIQDKTKNVRELLMARAFSSTMIEEKVSYEQKKESETNIEDILKDWFEKYE